MATKRSKHGVLQILGLARRAGAVALGTGAARDAVRRGRARLVLLAEDGARGQVNKLVPLLESRGTPHRTWGTKQELGGALGVAEATALAIVEGRFAEQVLSRLDECERRQ